MAEYLRSIEVRVDIDTNKRTYSTVIEADSLADAKKQVSDWLDEHYGWWLTDQSAELRSD